MLSLWPFKKAQDLQIRVVYPTGAHELFPLLVPKNNLDEYFAAFLFQATSYHLPLRIRPTQLTERLQLPEQTFPGAVFAGAWRIGNDQDPALGCIIKFELKAALERACEDDLIE
ncbi:Nucleosomal histone H3-Lys79 methylase [Puccinia graminis f. sp. tritici]|uniref:Nucleosomal histone H3-Lys79 methylase n=1 Tax=Puccinia graminis f. sp. tritici TaxID=56615 RepID=A0A5B0PVY4_PUCGR|nr:Nucleosomal histone H3-Lys79 methylase [Puccinia graminis f. sp. tritici]